MYLSKAVYSAALDPGRVLVGTGSEAEVPYAAQVGPLGRRSDAHTTKFNSIHE